MLSDLIGENDIDLPAIYSEHLTGDGQGLFKHASDLNFEGIISKRADAPYKSEGGNLGEGEDRPARCRAPAVLVHPWIRRATN